MADKKLNENQLSTCSVSNDVCILGIVYLLWYCINYSLLLLFSDN